MNPDHLDRIPPEWLAGYADDELPQELRARVEQWLSEDPERLELLDTQQSFGPANEEFWQSVRPPDPSPRRQKQVLDMVARTRPEHGFRRWRGWIGSVALAATAAVLLLLLPGGTPIGVTESDWASDEAGALDDEPVVMAANTDVFIISLPERAADLLLIGEHPLKDSVLDLAKGGEIEFLGVGSDLAGRFPERPTTDPTTSDIPMIWAPRGP